MVRRLRKGFWKDTGWIAGFTEMPRESQAEFMDVDSGPVLFGIGSVASAFGIGAAKTAGRIDHAAPLTMRGGCLLVADALWLPDSRPHGPAGGQELESGRGCLAVLDDQTHCWRPKRSPLRATRR